MKGSEAYMNAATETPNAGQYPLLQRRSNALLELGKSLQSNRYSFTTVTPLSHAYNNERYGQKWAESLRDVFGWSRPFLRPLIDAEDFDLMLQAGVLRPWGEGWRCSIRWSSLGDLLLAHSAYPTTSADAVFFGPDTYRFVAAVQQWLANNNPAAMRAVDIGCGSGAGAIALAKALPDCQVLATDINPHALQMTEINSRLANASNVAVQLSSLLDDVQGDVDLIIANPPYMMDAQERAYRHGGGELGAGLSVDIVEMALSRLTSGGSLLLYTGVAMVAGKDPFLGRQIGRAHV